jgi:hypothetical protein
LPLLIRFFLSRLLLSPPLSGPRRRDLEAELDDAAASAASRSASSAYAVKATIGVSASRHASLRSGHSGRPDVEKATAG